MSRPVNIAGHPILGRGDLVDAIASGHPEILDAVAKQLELEYRPPQVGRPDDLKGHPKPKAELQSVPRIDTSGYPSNVENVALWMVTQFASRGVLEPPPDGPSYRKWNNPPGDEPEYQLLAPWRVVGPRLRRGLADLSRGKLFDMDKLVATLA